MNTRIVIAAALVALPLLTAWGGDEAAMRQTWEKDDFSWIKGMNYIPSYARNDVEIWRDFDAAIIDRELGYAESMGINSVRVWLQYVVYEHNPQKFLKDFDTFLSLCEKRQILVMPVLFDSCFGQEPSIDWDGGWVMCPGTSREMPEHWPEIQKYVEAVVGGHVGDKRIVMWDVMNEPVSYEWTVKFVRHFVEQVGRLDRTHPLTIGSGGGAVAAAPYADIVDVLSMHCYAKTTDGDARLREDIAAMLELGEKHGKPVITSEVGSPGFGQDYAECMPAVRAAGIGWYVFELMIGKDDFNYLQGFLYPDGTCRRKEHVAAIMNIDPADVPFPEKPDAEGVPIRVLKPIQAIDLDPNLVRLFIETAATPTTPENIQARRELLKNGAGVFAVSYADDPEGAKRVLELWSTLIVAPMTISEETALSQMDEMLGLAAAGLKKMAEEKE